MDCILIIVSVGYNFIECEGSCWDWRWFISESYICFFWGISNLFCVRWIREEIEI